MSGGVVSIVLVESSRRIWSLKQFFAGELVCAEFSLRLEFGRTVLGLNLASEMVGQRNLLLQLRSLRFQPLHSAHASKRCRMAFWTVLMIAAASSSASAPLAVVLASSPMLN